MASRIEHSARYSKSVDAVHAAFTSEQYWKDRMAEIGGPGGQLLGIETANGTTTVNLQQSIAADKLPGVVTAVRPGDLVIKRSESWGPVTNGTTNGTFTAAVDGAPAKIGGTVTVTNDGTGSVAKVDGEVEVKIPLFGGKIESVIAEQLGRLLDSEDAFTEQWLDAKP
ncbi:DUF2505 domain-containing protein [Antrihabitans cavernicola]|uniref:DUF2505 domain-containing protein n=1 Tax=Antrihabitans cavernicola TaxID=2495913 RepID=A0A5A7S8S1_9NOCA|nr:DUF2505 domain-containing protein [Spelaeibacter cavernicola]KAA0022326.1 DUF2505 domain-containing protein [Spelaeibacter cavernicola]